MREEELKLLKSFYMSLSMFKALFLRRYLILVRCMDVAQEKSCVHYPICYLLIMKYIYANLMFASDLIFYRFCCFTNSHFQKNETAPCDIFERVNYYRLMD